MKKVTLVVGLGMSGLAAAEFLIRNGHLVLGIDHNRTLLQTNAQVRYLQSLGLFVQHDSDPVFWEEVDALIVSPGISPKHPLYLEAKKTRTKIIGEAELALPHFQKPLLAVTGTNGKTTVTLLVEHVLNAAGIKAKALGNVGVPLCQWLLEGGDEQVFVVELSSYQLETMQTPVFETAVLLNVTPDHLDRYASVREYAQAKFHLQNLVKREKRFFVQKEAATQFADLLTSQDFFDDTDSSLSLECLDSAHDRENALAAWALCRSLGITSAQFCNALATFKKPSHRIELVREINGVSFFDD